MARTPEVDAWFDAYDNPMKPVVRRLREMVLEADPVGHERVRDEQAKGTHQVTSMTALRV